MRDEDIDIYEIEADAKRRLLAAIQRGREQHATDYCNCEITSEQWTPFCSECGLRRRDA